MGCAFASQWVKMMASVSFAGVGVAVDGFGARARGGVRKAGRAGRRVAVRSDAAVLERPPSEEPAKRRSTAPTQWTIIRGQRYDITDFMARHPGGSTLLRLAVGRDATGLFDSSHMRPEVSTAMLRKLPKLDDLGLDDGLVSGPYPNDSEFYQAVRARVRQEVFANGKIWHRGGQEKNSAAIIASAVVAYAWYATSASLLSGFVLGLAGAWIGLTLQHCGNHGAMTRWAWVNDLLGFTNDIAGGSSLCWRYHHQVSHHIHTNVHDVDQDVYSATPLLRFDARCERRWFHKYQHVYMWMLFPFMTLGFHLDDVISTLKGEVIGAKMHGVSTMEKVLSLSGKVIHFSLLLGVPAYIHGLWAILPAYFMYPLTQGIALAATFAVSHNLDEVKQTPLSDDWAVAQVENSANWGGAIGNFFTGGLNYQIEHHLFPSIGFGYYPAIGKIVEEECGKRGIHYAKYKTLPEILAKFCDFMAKTGAAPAPTDVIKVVKA